ncbi:hypothetical protein ACOMHN_007044 [Nucella lapillus]
MVMMKVENEMDTEPSGPGRALPFSVSPVALQLNRLVERTQQSSSAMFQLPPGAIPSICMAPTLPTPPRVVSSTSTQPLPSILKPATLCQSASGQALTLGGPAPVGDGKGPVPVQFVLPTPGMGSGAMALDSCQLAHQPTQLVLMPTPQTSSAGGGGGAASNGGSVGPNSKHQSPVLTFASVASSSASPSPLAGPTANSPSGPRATSAPMILFLAGPPATAAAAGSSSMAVSNSTSVPMSLQQSISNGQVESLLKQMLESSKSSSS